MGEDRGQIADRFRLFADEARDHGGLLYAHLSRIISDDPAVLTVAAEVHRPPIPNTFFAAIHYLLLQEANDPLGQYYGSIRRHPKNREESYPAFRAFVLNHREQLVPILQTRITQTNEVRRCSYLVPAFQCVYEEGGRFPLSLIDVGCSAGLHLMWDRYHYDYGSVQIGDSRSSVQIDCDLRGSLRPPIPENFPPSAFRMGVDLNPIDLGIPEERRWLEALVFPDHEDRRILLKTAIEAALQDPPDMVMGDALRILPEILDRIPVATTVCVYHCHAMYQLSPQSWDAFRDMLVTLSAKREIFWLNAEGYEVQLRHLRRGEIGWVKLANKDGHARWLEWLKAEKEVL